MANRCSLQPAFDDDLAIHEEVDRVRALTVQVAEEQVLLAAKRERGGRRGDADIDADVSGVNAILEVTSVLAAGGERLAALP